MSFKSSKNESIVCSNFIFPVATYTAGGQNCLILANPPAGASLFHNQGAYLSDTITSGGITGFQAINLNTDGIYSVNVKLNNDFVGTATPTVIVIYIYAFLETTGQYRQIASNETICPIWTTDSSITASAIFDTRVIGSKKIAINIASGQTFKTTSVGSGYLQGISVVRVSL